MSKGIRTVFVVDTLSLTECKDGYYLYDKTQGMNIAMRAKTEQDACIEGLLYYSKKLSKVELDYKILNSRVQDFLLSFPHDDEYE